MSVFDFFVFVILLIIVLDFAVCIIKRHFSNLQNTILIIVILITVLII